MQQNDLEKFIQDQRQDFDDAYPSLKLWANIEKELDQKEELDQPVPMRASKRPWYQIAAAVLILISVGGIGGMYLAQGQQPSAEELIAQIAPEFGETEQYYSNKIQQQYAKLTTHTRDPEIDADLAQVDQAMAELRQELLTAPKGREEQLVQELIESYRLKLQILERILEHIEQTKNISTNNSSNEKSI